MGGSGIQGGMPSQVSLQGWGFFKNQSLDELEIEQRAIEQGTSVSFVRQVKMCSVVSM